MSLPARSVLRSLVLAASLAALVVSSSGSGLASRSIRARTVTGHMTERPLVENGGAASGGEVLEAMREYAQMKTAPAETVPGAAYQEALARASALSVVGGAWDEITDVPYNAENPNYADPIFSNVGSGNGRAGGRVQALAVDRGTVYAGAADGGLWRSTDGGDTWKPLTDDLATTSSGALAIDPATHDVWYGTGEASTAFENYLGSGIYVSSDRGNTWRRVGGDQLDGTLVAAITFDGVGHVFAATSRGIYRRPTTGPVSDPWTLVLAPGTRGPYGFRLANDVQVRPGTGGREVVATLGWRGGPTDYNGFYVSHDFGAKGTWQKVKTTGELRSTRIARASLAYSADGSRLYALVESWQNYSSKPSALEGIFVSRSGRITGRWDKRAGWHKLAASGSALAAYGSSFAPGVQAWYNQFIGVDPSDRDHVYVGLEEVFETRNGGTDWKAIGPYWNFTLPCYPDCPNTTHPDQHAVAFSGGKVWVGDDGGVYSRKLSDHQRGGWNNHNADLHALQYYYAGVSQTVAGASYWGGLQDNGVSFLGPNRNSMVSPFGGDGGDVIAHPSNPRKAVVEYTDLDMALTTNGGLSDGSTTAWTEMTPSCFAFTYTPSPCDPNPRFIAPFRADPQAPNTHWVAGGQYVWESNQGWSTSCSAGACDWSQSYDTGDGNQVTALGVDGSTIYAGWCGGATACNPTSFESGIATNASGSWLAVAGPAITNGGDPLPQRYVTALTVDASNDQHVYAVYGAYSRRWIPGGGVGHVFESTDGGANWTDISGNLPDAPADDLVISGTNLILATDVGVFVADSAAPTSWSRLGSGLPHAAVNDLTLAPDGTFVVAVTHGRGLWKLPTP